MVIVVSIIALFISMVGCFFIYRAVKAIGVNRARMRGLREVPMLHPKSEDGDIVKLVATIVYPCSSLPYTGKKVAYWRSVLSASFRTKAKAPSRGMDTHTPRLETLSCADEPIILETSDGRVIHVCIQSPKNSFINLLLETKFFFKVPERAKEFAKAKYTGYKTEERYLPIGCHVLVMGEVVDINPACTTISERSHAGLPAFISAQLEKEMVQDFASTVALHWAVIVCCVSVIVVSWYFVRLHW